jgi:hypothetical protein
MTVNDLWQVLTPSVTGIIGVAAYSVNRFIRLEHKIEVLWDFHMRRAKTEFVAKDLGAINSPVILNPETRAWYDGMAADLKMFYGKVGARLTERELFIEIEQRFGDRLQKEICIPHGLTAGACILAAMAICRESTP